MAPHRRARSSGPLGMRTPAPATAAPASVALLSQTADASPAAEPAPDAENTRPSTEEVRKKIDDLYQRAVTATEKYNAAKERTTRQRRRVDTLLGDVAKRTGAAAPDSAALLAADNPQDYFDRTRLMNRLTARQKQAVDDYVTRRAATTTKRQQASEGLETLTTTENALKTSKADVQRKLAEARGILARLTAEEEARLAAIERERQAVKAAKAAEALAFARAQIGKPYVWGASGPGSYDCSGLTQAAWKAAGVTLPRTTWDQVGTGTAVSVDSARPGDLVFFYDDISHVGICVGDGMMIHAPKPGAYVREESIHSMPIHSVVRPT
ncbi:cell wall-associated NlpC family hydrolase [Streptomyces sp. V3I8]|uniref:C40 family peptidase n=1 Tax=Streptomyces sp. V3I8 TaxID=3042279 RepID=UPI00278AE2A4|nr:C40 family peptidase [Streptomyces sp. V3I8]MDQ1036637.1 cell wall-associated NlpC family hydrolase [Streptomyces sp. V3I8]